MHVYVLRTFTCVSAASAASPAPTHPSIKEAALRAAPLRGFLYGWAWGIPCVYECDNIGILDGISLPHVSLPKWANMGGWDLVGARKPWFWGSTPPC